MSRAFIRSGVMVGLAGSLLLSPIAVPGSQAQTPQPNRPQQPAPTPSPARPAQTPQQPAQPLTEAQVLQRLEVIPVFTITNAEGAPIIASSPQVASGAQIASFFLSYQDAQTVLNQIRSNNPNVGSQAKIVPLSMSRAYQLIRQNQPQTAQPQGTNRPAQGNAQPRPSGQAAQGQPRPSGQNAPPRPQGNPENIVFQFLPREDNVRSALEILRADGQQVQDFPGVPLFFAVGNGQNGQNNQGLLTIEQNGREVIPFFFDKGDLQALLDRLRQQQPNVVNATSIEVTTLGRVISSMLDRNANADAGRIALVPSRQAIESVRQIQGNGQGQPGQPAQPGQAQPAQPARPAQPPSGQPTPRPNP